MRILSVGRASDCDIVVNDATDQISRRHALLRFYPLGKIEIVPQGQNHTYLNGIPLKNGRPYRVHRSDVISLARVQSLNWKKIQDPYTKIRVCVGSFVALVILMFAILGTMPYWSTQGNETDSVPILNGGGGGSGTSVSPVDPTPSDTVKQEKKSDRFKFPKKPSEKNKKESTDKKTETIPSDENNNDVEQIF